MNGHIDVDVGEPRLAEEPVGASADVKIDPLRTRMRVVGGAQPRIFGRGRIHRLRLDVRFEACDPAPGLNQRDDLANDQFRVRHVDEHKAHMRAVERRAWQSGVIGVALANLDLRQPKVGGEPARLLDEMRAAVDPENRTGRTDALAQEMQNASRAASDIDDALSGLDPDPFELCVGIRREISNLPLEALFFASAAPKQVNVRFRQIEALIIERYQLVTRGRPDCHLQNSPWSARAVRPPPTFGASWP